MPKQMDRFSLISTNIPFEIQYRIILIAENLWYNKLVNMIIDQWYKYMERKMSMFKISLTLTTKYWGTTSALKIIDPICSKNIEKMKYMYKYFTGKTEDIYYWKTLLRKVCKGLIEIKLQNKDITIENKNYREMSNITFSFITKIMKSELRAIQDPVISEWLNIYLLNNASCMAINR